MTWRSDAWATNGEASSGEPELQELQENTYGPSWDYRAGSPHLMHWQLYDRLVKEVLCVLRTAVAPTTVLEIGAGHGGYTEPLLAAGHHVTATEMSRPSLARLKERFGSNEKFSCAFDSDGSLDILGGRTFSLVLCVSVLHHIPDYTSFVQRALSRHLEVGGSFISIQDPLWYPNVPRATRRLDRLAYLSWRSARGRYREGARTQLRRMRGVYDPSNPADMVEYHVVRNGVDEEALRTVLERSFGQVRLETYWSTPAATFQRAGARLGLRNTFMLVAQGNLGDVLTLPDSSLESIE